jgi:hypothetical protein
MTTPTRTSGPEFYSNWKASVAGCPYLGGFEAPLYTDAHITGQINHGLGPYEILNAIAIHHAPLHIQPAVVLRAGLYQSYETPSFKETRDDTYHGGRLADEIAALVALSLGVRIRAGPASREFDADVNDKGRPTATHDAASPYLSVTPRAMRGSLVLPKVHETANLNEGLKLAENLNSLAELDAIALIRSARLFQDAIWIAETEAHLSWLMLVSAIETAADHWHKVDDPVEERLRDWNPTLADLLESRGGQGLVQEVAEHIVHVTGATRKFLSFMIQFMPDAPTDRPPVAYQHKWSKTALKKSFSAIYDHRSKALHRGSQFPAPMCFPPMRFGQHFAEVPTSMGVGRHVWLQKDLPMYLHTFVFIVRHALLNWLQSMIPPMPKPQSD